VGDATYGTKDELWEALQHATALDPSFAPYYVHVAENAVLRGDSTTARKTIERYYALGADSSGITHVVLAIPILLGTDQQAADAIRLAGKWSAVEAGRYDGTFARRHNRFDRDAAMDSVLAVVMKIDRKLSQSYYAGSMGAIERGNRLAHDPGTPAASRAMYYAHVFELWNLQPPPEALKPDACPPNSVVCPLMVGIMLADLGRWAEHQQLMTRLSAAAKVEADTAKAGRMNNAVEVLRGVAMHRRGDVSGARELLTRYTRAAGEGGLRARYELAWLEAGAKRPAEALRHFKLVENAYLRPAALYGAATMHEQLGESAKANEYWAQFVKLTEKGDGNLPRIAEARRKIANRM
jgi:Tfp pilus assembly protein PilF